MFKKINEEFKLYDREENFSVEGRRAIYEYLTDLEEETGEKIEEV